MQIPWRRLGIGAGISAALATALGYRFALEYRRRAGFPYRRPVEGGPDGFELPCESVEIESGEDGELRLPAWFIPADTAQDEERGAPAVERPAVERPAVVIVHGWESNRARVLGQAKFLHAAGFHCLTFDVRGHGDNPPESLPITAVEFGNDAAAAVRYVANRRDVTSVAVLGHSMGGAAALLAAAATPEIAAAVAIAAPSDPIRLTRAAFRLGGLYIPAPFDLPLAWLTAHVFIAPRGHSLAEASASAAAGRYRGPLLLVHGAEDRAVPVSHLYRIAAAALAARGGSPAPALPALETLVLPGLGHRWLYESPAYRRTVARFLAANLAGSLPAGIAADLAADCDVKRPDDPVQGFGALNAWRK